MVPDEVLRRIAMTIGELDLADISDIRGGSINRSYRLSTRGGDRYFLKLNEASALEMFEAERAGLAELKAAAAVRVPDTFACDVSGGTAFLLMEYLDLGTKSALAGTHLGTQLAGLHRHSRPEFGWHRDNTIGSTQQINGWDPDWLTFFRDKRLAYQLRLAGENGFDDPLQSRGERLLERLPDFFTGYFPSPSLLHGDLWGGNWGTLINGEPVIFDPAPYYGDREADIAMTRLFGGFSPEFYSAYNEAWALDHGFERRCDLYNLYHVLNHLNLFGQSYLNQASEILDRLLANK
jgi:protein-ribulosamine 3-kinase